MITPFIPQGDAPVGSVIAFAGRVGPPVASPSGNPQGYPSGADFITNNIEGWGWMVCDGRQLYCSAYPQLFQAIGHLYQLEGDKDYGTSPPADAVFRIPDFRGYFLRGAAGSATVQVGDQKGQPVDPDQAKRLFANGNTASNTADNVGSIQGDAFQTHVHQYHEIQKIGTIATKSDGAPFVDIKPNETLPPKVPDARTSTETRPINYYVHYLIKYAYLTYSKSLG